MTLSNIHGALNTNWNEYAIHVVGDMFSPEPFHPQWMSLHRHHQPYAIGESFYSPRKEYS